jgi:MYXO-CTERM domain-containing protein
MQESYGMKPKRARTPWRLKRTVFALLIAALAAQAGSASHAPQASGGSAHRVHPRAAIVPLTLEHELWAWSARVSSEPPVSGGWALLLAGLAGVWAIGRRRISATGSGGRALYRLRRR